MTTGIAVCREEDYDALRAIIEDAHEIPTAWQDFIKQADAAQQFWEEQRHSVIKVEISQVRFCYDASSAAQRLTSRQCTVLPTLFPKAVLATDHKRQPNAPALAGSTFDR
jgi:hypothetical protein